MNPETADRVLSAATRAAIHSNLRDDNGPAGYLRLAFLNQSDIGFADYLPALLAGQIKHVEIAFPENSPVGPVGFSAYSGEFPALDNPGLFRRGLRYLESWVRTPPVLRMACLLPRTYQDTNYKFISFPVTNRQLAQVYRECDKIHGKPFNAAGLYRSVIPGFQRQTDGERFFCSEAVLYTLQNAGVLDAWLPEEADFLSRVNPGSVTPTILYNTLEPYGIELGNQIYAATPLDRPVRRVTYYGSVSDG